MAYVHKTVRQEIAHEGDHVVEADAAEETKSVLANLIWFFVGFVEVLLAFRFIFKVLGANPGSGFVNLIYSLSGVFLAPFTGIFRQAATDGVETTSVFEPAILIAMLVYALIGWGLARLVYLNRRQAQV